MEAFRKYNFDGDERWLAYLGNLEFPPTANRDALVLKFKAKWFKREVDPSFDPALVTGPVPTNSTGPSTAGPAPKSAPSSQPAPTTQPASSTPPTAPAKGLRFWTANPQARLFLLHAAMMLTAVLHLQPLNRRLSLFAWRTFMQLAIVNHAYKVYLKFGTPPLRPFPAAVKTWLQQAAPTTDFQYVLLGLVFTPQKPMALMMFPMAVLATYHAFAFAAGHFPRHPLWLKYGAHAHSWLTAKQTEAQMYNAACEIGVGALVIVGLFSAASRNLLLLVLYWNFLKMRYFAPDSSYMHQMVWRQIDAATSPLFARVPMLRVPISYVQRWFLSVPH